MQRTMNDRRPVTDVQGMINVEINGQTALVIEHRTLVVFYTPLNLDTSYNDIIAASTSTLRPSFSMGKVANLPG